MQSQLERCIAELDEQYQRMQDICRADRAAYDDLLRQAAEADQAAFDFEMLLRQISAWRRAMTRRRLLMDQVYRVLETDRAALDALAAGRLLASLRQNMPDAAEIAALLDQTAEATDGMRARQEAIACAARENGVRLALSAEAAAAVPEAEEWIAAKPAGLPVSGMVCAAERGRGS